jgi:hypothetical protein
MKPVRPVIRYPRCLLNTRRKSISRTSSSHASCTKSARSRAS